MAGTELRRREVTEEGIAAPVGKPLRVSVRCAAVGALPRLRNARLCPTGSCRARSSGCEGDAGVPRAEGRLSLGGVSHSREQLHV